MSTTEGQVPNSEKLSYGGNVEKRSLHDSRSSSQGHINITHIEQPGCLWMRSCRTVQRAAGGQSVMLSAIQCYVVRNSVMLSAIKCYVVRDSYVVLDSVMLPAIQCYVARVTELCCPLQSVTLPAAKCYVPGCKVLRCRLKCVMFPATNCYVARYKVLCCLLQSGMLSANILEMTKCLLTLPSAKPV